MRASQVLQRCLDSALSPMHALRRQTLLLAVESLLAGRRLVLIDLARSKPQGQGALSLFPSLGANRSPWIPAFAGMTNKSKSLDSRLRGDDE